MSKINKISGFPEWLPKEKFIEERFISLIKEVYQSYGFIPIETPAVELVSTLLSKGVIDKEIYLLKRARQEADEESDLGLHFDLTVPLARYVAQNFSSLAFPFKRYQLQKVWRGERPQKGRFREFYQFDIDTIAVDDLPLSADCEVLSAVGDVFKKLDLGRFRIRTNSRKLLLGIYEAIGVKEELRKEVITAVDKIEKIKSAGVAKLLNDLGLSDSVSGKILSMAELRFKPSEAEQELKALGIDNATFQRGISEIATLCELASKNALENTVIDLSLARGLDYYTGLIFEVVFEDFPDFGSVCSGGRYDNLASQFIKKKLPGVGVSIGLTRLMDLVFSNKIISLEAESTVKALVAVLNEDQRKKCTEIAGKLRELGVACEVYYKSPKLGKQIDYAAAKNIPYVMFVSEDGEKIEVKDLKSKEQRSVPDLESFARSLK